MFVKNIRKDIIDSYEKLIHDCEVQIEKGLDIQKNEFLIGEYKYVLNQVKEKTEKEYDNLTKQIEEIYEFSTAIYEFLAPIHPKRNNKVIANESEDNIEYNRIKWNKEETKWLNLDLNMQ